MPRKKAKPFKLSQEQKDEILQMFEHTPDLMAITKEVFKDPDLDGRSLQGRAVRAFLKEQSKEYKTTLCQKSDEVELSQEQKEFLMSDHIEAGMKGLEIARLVYKDVEIQSLSLKHRAVMDFLNKFRPEIIDESQQIANERWVPPKALSRAIKKVNDWVGTNYDEVTMPTKQKKMCEKLLIYLRSPRFMSNINGYSLVSDRELFESEFVRVVWDKPDLTVDELNLYITVCSNYVRQKHIQQRMDKLNALLDESENERDITIRLTEILKTTSEELNQCEKRIESLTKDLNGSRQVRLKARGDQNSNLLALVEAFQNKEERDRMVMLAEMKNKAVEEEAEKFESMDELKARILGISKEELL